MWRQGILQLALLNPTPNSVRNKIGTIVIALALAGASSWLVLHESFRIKSGVTLTKRQLYVLDSLGREALTSQDVPVASVVLLRDSIIGMGYNTVHADTNLGGHAEINAISDAAKRIGVQSFLARDRSAMTVLTTFEPCAMCAGALQEYGIRHVVFVREKSFRHHLRQSLMEWRYQWGKKQSAQRGLQDSLFVQHPDYANQSEE